MSNEVLRNISFNFENHPHCISLWLPGLYLHRLDMPIKEYSGPFWKSWALDYITEDDLKQLGNARNWSWAEGNMQKKSKALAVSWVKLGFMRNFSSNVSPSSTALASLLHWLEFQSSKLFRRVNIKNTRHCGLLVVIPGLYPTFYISDKRPVHQAKRRLLLNPTHKNYI